MTPEETAKYIFDKNVRNFTMIGVSETAKNHFAKDAALNEMAEWETRRYELYGGNASELAPEYWQQVKQHIQSL